MHIFNATGVSSYTSKVEHASKNLQYKHDTEEKKWIHKLRVRLI